MNAAYQNEWQLYRRGAQLPPIVGLEPKTDSEFDADVAVGEVRISAAPDRPRVALVVEDRRLSGWRIVPVSPFCAPASARELMVGERVFQRWNATVVSRRFASRSWRVDAISDSDLAEIRGAIAAANPGRVTAGDGVQAKYEREFLVGEGTLVPFAEPRAADLPRFGWMQISLKIAASLALCLAAWYVLMMDSGRQIVRNWRGGFHAVDIAQEDATIDLVDAREVREAPTEIAEVNIDFTPPSVTWYGPAPEVFRPAKFADVKGPKVPESIKKFTLDRDRFISPISAPMEVVFLSGGERKSHAPAQSGELRYAAAIAPLAEPPKVTCKLVNDTRSGLCVDKILRIEGEVAEGAKITVMFDWDVVEGYGKLSSTASDCKVWINYELMAFSGKTISPESVFVTLIWPSKDGDERTPVPVGQ